jgi:hypothetical protein
MTTSLLVSEIVMPESLPPKDTEISLEKHLESRLDGIVALIEARFTSIQRAVDKAEQAMNDRLEGMNEFRDTLRDQAAKFATVIQLEDRMTAALAQVSRVEERLRELERNAVTRLTLEAEMKSEREVANALADRLSRVERFMWLMLGAFVLLQVIAPYLRTILPGK